MAQLEKLTTFGFITKYSRGSSANFINLLKNRRFSQINKIRKNPVLFRRRRFSTEATAAELEQ